MGFSKGQSRERPERAAERKEFPSGTWKGEQGNGHTDKQANAEDLQGIHWVALHAKFLSGNISIKNISILKKKYHYSGHSF